MSISSLRDFGYRHAKGLSAILRYLTVGIIPIVVGLVIFSRLEVYPFGENSLLSLDLWGQYYPMFREFARADSISEAMYSWNGALGFNSYVQSAFYCRSIFLIPLKWIPINASLAYIDAVCILRWGLSAVTCLWFLEKKFQKKNVLLMALAIAYGLCAYSLSYVMQFMWTDLMIYAPLILLGVDRLLDGRSPLFYTAALALAVYSNFYVAFGTCIFTALYYMAETVKRAEYDRTRPFFKRVVSFKAQRRLFWRFAGCSVLAAAIDAVVLVPTLLGLSQTSSASTASVDFEKWYHTLAENVQALLPDTGASLEYGVANIAAGLFLFLLVPLYFMNTAVSYREKAATGVFLSVLYIGLNYNPADYLFNGCHFPNQLPGRWSFLFSLALIMVAANGLMKPRGIRARSVISAYIIGVFFMCFSRYSELTEIHKEQLGRYVLWLTLAAVLLLVSVAVYRRCHAKKPVPQEENEGEEKAEQEQEHARRIAAYHRIGVRCMALALALLFTAEITTNAVQVTTAEKGGMRTSSMKHYLHATNVFDTFGSMYDSDENTFYRIENNGGWTFDDGQLGGFKGITYYGSTMNGDVYNLLRLMGNRVYTLNISSLYNTSSPVQNGLFGVRYFIDKSKNLPDRLTEIEKVEEYEDCIVWENPTALPLGFGVDSSAAHFSLGEDIHALSTQNRLVNALYGSEINVYEKQNSTVNKENNRWEYTMVCDSDAPLYLEQNFHGGKLTVYVGDMSKEVDVGTELFKFIGSFPKGTQVTAVYEVSGHNNDHAVLDFYHFNAAKWDTVYRALSEQSLTVTSFKNTAVDGEITMNHDGMMVTSIPQDGGWTVYVDGERVSSSVLAGCLITVPLKSGTHTVTFRYRVPGLVGGAAVTLLALLAIVVSVWWHRRRQPKKEKPIIPPKPPAKPPKAKTAPAPKKAPSPRVMIDDPL